MKVKKILGLACLLGVTLAASAQDDLGVWTSVEGSTKLGAGFGTSIEGEFRTRDNSQKVDRYSGGISIDYKNKKVPFLKLDAGYTFIYNHNPAETKVKYQDDGITPKHKNVDAAYWGSKHRAVFSVNGSFLWKRLKFSLRERYQYTYRAAATTDRVRLYYNPFSENHPEIPSYFLDEDPASEDYSYMKDEKKAKHDQKLRSRLAVSYDIKKCKFEPFAEVEAYNELDNAMALDKMRYTVGTDYKLSKTQKLTAYYRYQDKSDEDEVGGHVLGISYSFKF